MTSVGRKEYKTKKGTRFSWEIRYKDTFGKRKYQSGFETKVEAERALAKITNDIQEGNPEENKKMTFAEAVQLYLDLHVDVHCRKSTASSYKGYLNNHILPFFGHMKLVDITPIMVQKFIQVKLKSDMTKETTNKLIVLLGSVFQKMVDDDVIIKNPVRKVKKLKLDHKEELKILSVKELKALLDTAEKHYNDFFPLLFTAIYTGMRQGELFALTWDKINWVTYKISIDKSYTHGYLDVPKTQKSIRKIDMSKELAKVLKKWQLQCPHSEHNLVFPNAEGKYTDASNMTKRRYLPVLRRAGLPRMRFHDLRHTYASLLLAKNVQIKYIQHQLGHSSIQVTMDRYAHIMPEIREQSVNILDSLFTQDNQEASDDKTRAAG